MKIMVVHFVIHLLYENPFNFLLTLSLFSHFLRISSLFVM